MKRLRAVALLLAGLVSEQTNPKQLTPILEKTLQAPEETTYHLREYLRRSW